MSIERITYSNWANCYRLYNQSIDLVITTDVGPRIIRCGFTGQANLFGEFPEQIGKSGGDEWRIYGGHRFWHAPEHPVRTYDPDNNPVEFEEQAGFVRLIQLVEPRTGLQKEMDIALDPDEARVTVTHRLRNHNLWGVELSPWALTVMNTCGTAVIPLPPRGSHSENLLPTNTLTMWAYTDFADPRWTLGREYLLLSQDTGLTGSQKIGLGLQYSLADAWLAYSLGNFLFAKRTRLVPGAAYPDMGCCVEIYTDARILELETLGPLAQLPAGGVVEHIEEWRLFHGAPAVSSEADVVASVLPRLKDSGLIS